MADITFRYTEMGKAVEDIRSLASQYASTANDFSNNFTASISGWEGEAHEKMVTFIQGPVMEYARDTIQKLLESLAELLQANIDQMKSADQQIADNIPASLSGGGVAGGGGSAW